jgi:hypothetical protein
VNDLRQLALDLRKKNLEPSHASLGLMLFERFQALGISPELADKWSELTKRFVPIDFPVEEFFGAALRLHELEKTEGRPEPVSARVNAFLTNSSSSITSTRLLILSPPLHFLSAAEY